MKLTLLQLLLTFVQQYGCILVKLQLHFRKHAAIIRILLTIFIPLPELLH